MRRRSFLRLLGAAGAAVGLGCPEILAAPTAAPAPLDWSSLTEAVNKLKSPNVYVLSMRAFSEEAIDFEYEYSEVECDVRLR